MGTKIHKKRKSPKLSGLFLDDRLKLFGEHGNLYAALGIEHTLGHLLHLLGRHGLDHLTVVLVEIGKYAFVFPGTQLATYVKGGIDYNRSNTSNDYTDGNYRIGLNLAIGCLF